MREAIQNGKDAELVNFDYTTDGQVCETLAISHGMHFVVNPQAHAGFFRKRA